MATRSTEVFDDATRKTLIAAGVLRAPATVSLAPRKKSGPRAPQSLLDAETAFRAIEYPQRGDLSRVARQFNVNPGTLHARLHGRHAPFVARK